MSLVRLASAVTIFCAMMLAQPAGQGVISGVAIDPANGEPVRKAIVTVTWHGTPRSWATNRTDGSGQFRFEGLPPGKYDLRATKVGLGSAIYGANSVREIGDVITLGEGDVREGLKLRFLHSGVLSGRVLDSGGDPLAGTMVRILRPGRNLGNRVLTNYRTVTTNDRGEYHATNIDPGQYYLMANPSQVRMQGFPPPNGVLDHLKEVPQFLGGVREWKDSSPVTIHGGENLTGLDFRMTAEPAVHIHGRVTGVPDLGPMPKPPDGTISMDNGQRIVQVSISPAEQGGLQWNMGAGAQPPDYQFDLGDQVPGRYRIEASVEDDKKQTYSASQVIEMRENSGEITLALAPAVDIKGHFRMEGQGGQQKNGFEIRLAQGGAMRRGNISAHAASDGSFTLVQVPPGEWELTVDTIPRGGFLKSVFLGDKDVIFSRIQIEPGSTAQLNIVASMNSAKIEGEVDAGARDSKQAGIVLAPLGNRHTLARFYYGTAADDEGKFTITGIAPGKYKIFALEKLRAADFRNPEAADQLVGLGEEIELAENAALNMHPKLIPIERAREALP